MNEYQKALETAYEMMNTTDFGSAKIGCEALKVLTELVEKEKILTLEECIKEWKALGYEFKYDQKLEHIFISSLLAHLEDKHIHIFLKDSISVMFSEYGQFTAQELELLTKTMKASVRL